MVTHDAATVIRATRTTETASALCGGLDQEFAKGVAEVAFAVLQRKRPGLTGGRLWAVLADEIREELASREMETNVMAAAYALVFPSLSLGGEHV